MPKGASRDKKNSSRKSKGKRSSSEASSLDMAKEIAAAVDMLPERVMAEYEERKQEERPSRMTIGHVEEEKRRLLYVGVAGLLFLLLIMWGWNARAFIGAAFSSPSSASLFPKTKKSIASIFEQISQTSFDTSSTTVSSSASTEAALEGSLSTLFTASTTGSTTTTTSTTSPLAPTSSAMIR